MLRTLAYLIGGALHPLFAECYFTTTRGSSLVVTPLVTIHAVDVRTAKHLLPSYRRIGVFAVRVSRTADDLVRFKQAAAVKKAARRSA